MSVGKSLWYHWNVDVLGKSILRMVRWQSQWRAKNHPRWKSEFLTPPLDIAPRVKELIGLHYLKGKYAHLHDKVAWVTSGAPVEVLKALGFYVFYPENHAAICGTLRTAVDIASYAEKAGYSCDLCCYARTDIGSMLSGKTPVGRLPKPDLLMTCTNICQTVLYWYRVLAHHFNIPLIVIDTPFIYDQPAEHAVKFVQKQIEDAVPVMEEVAHRSLVMAKFKEVVRLSKMACELWQQVMERGKNRPTPISVFDQFVLMAPIVEMRGEAFTVDFYAAMLEEIDERIAHNTGAVKDERKRLLWDNLPIWYRMRYLAELLGRHGCVIAASTYTNAWGELAHLIDAERPFESAAQTYISPILNRGTGHKFNIMKQMIESYKLDGVILHSNRSCKPYSIGQIDQCDRLIHQLQIPTLLLEADHSDSRYFSEEQTTTRVGAFVEMLEKN